MKRRPVRVSSLRTGGALLKSAHHIGFITYPFLKVFQGKFSQVHPLMYVVTAGFLVYFIAPVFV